MGDRAVPASVTVDGGVFAAHPEYIALILLAEGIGNGPSDDGSAAALHAAEQHLLARGLPRAAEDPHIAAWRAAFSAFGAKPSKYPCSAEALAARVLKGGTLPRVNVLVDLYNAVSARALTPVGGEDLDHLQGGLRLAIADGDEPFDGHDGAPRPGEIVWRDDAGVTCRRWNVGLGDGGTQRLPRIVGMGRAKHLILTGDTIDARQALEWGLVTAVMPAGQLQIRARELAKKILRQGPLAAKLAKLALNASARVDLDSGLLIETLAQGLCYSSEDKAEGTAAFLEKRKPKFTGK